MASSTPSPRTSMQSAPSPTVLSSMMARAVGVGMGLRVVTSIRSEHIVDRAPGSLRLGPAGHSFSDDVEIGDSAPEIRAHHGIADGIERDLSALLFLEQRVGVFGARFLAGLQRALGRTAAADVAKHDHRACECIAAVANRRRAAFDGDADAARLTSSEVSRRGRSSRRFAARNRTRCRARARVVVDDLEASRERVPDGVGRIPGGDQFVRRD